MIFFSVFFQAFFLLFCVNVASLIPAPSINILCYYNLRNLKICDPYIFRLTPSSALIRRISSYILCFVYADVLSSIPAASNHSLQETATYSHHSIITFLSEISNRFPTSISIDGSCRSHISTFVDSRY